MDAMKRVLALAAVSEAATGLALVIVPSFVGRLLLGAELTGVSIPVARVTGLSLIGLGLACWPGGDADRGLARAIRGMLCYSVPVTVYLACLGIGRKWAGPLLWPAVVAHALLSFLLARAWLKDRQSTGQKAPCRVEK